MSYILDALREAERQRPPDRGPDLFQVPGPRGPGGRWRGWLVAAAAAVAGVGIGIGVWLAFAPAPEEPPVAASEEAAPLAERIVEATHPPPRTVASTPVAGRAEEEAETDTPASPGQQRPAPRRRVSPVASPAQPASPAPAAGGVSVTVAPPSSGSPPGNAAAPARATPTAGEQEPIPARAPAARVEWAAAPVAAPLPAEAGGEVVVETSKAPPAEVLPDEQPATPAPAGESEMPGAEPGIEDGASLAAEDAGEAPPPAPAPPAVPPPDGRVVGLASLPAEVLSAWPNVALSGHVWSEEQSLRLVVIDGRIVREGGEAAPGVVLERITAEGAVLGFRGYRVLVEAP